MKDYEVELCSIKEQFDTTTSHGRLILTVLMALAQFEREHTAERTSDAMIAPAENGLWNGGQLFGFNLAPERKGYLVPNEIEMPGLGLAMDACLEQGTITAAQVALNRAGYRTKAYTSRRGVYHAPREFSYTTTQHMLKNAAYIGKKRVKDGLVDAVWPGRVDEDKFERVQELLAANARSKRSVATPVRHAYVLTGVLMCACGSSMEGRSGTGRGAVKYFYYRCRNDDCAASVPTDEIEHVVIDRLQALATDPAVHERLVAEANLRQRKKLPALTNRRASMVKMLTAVAADADRRLSEWSSIMDERARTFVTDALSALAQQKGDLEQGIADVNRELVAIEASEISREAVQAALSSFGDVYGCLQPHEQKELVRLLVRRVEISERRIVLEIRGGIAGPSTAPEDLNSASRSMRPRWLPDEDSNLEPSG